MKKLFAKLGLSLVAGSTLVASSANAQGGSLFDWCNFGGCWEVGAAAIYQQHCWTNWPYAISKTTGRAASLEGKYRTYNIQPQWDWGFKVWGAWYSCDGCEFASLTYKHLWTKHTRKNLFTFAATPFVDVDHLGTFNVAADFPLQATATAMSQYDSVYLRAGRNLHCGCDSRFYAFGGLRWVGAEIRRQVRAVNETSGLPFKYNERTRFEGGGFELGVGGEYGIGCGFNLIGTFSTLALVGNRNDTATTLISNAPLAYNESRKFPGRDICKCVPGVDFKIGLNYTYDWSGCGCCVRIVGEIGWEMDYYWNILAIRRGEFGLDAGEQDVEVVGGEVEALPINFGNNGPYISLALRF